MKKLIYTLVTLFLSMSLMGQKVELPEGFKEGVQKEYNELITDTLHKKEFKQSFESFYDVRVKSYVSFQKYLETVAAQKSATDLCSNGTFESGSLNANDWMFYWEQTYPVFQSGQNMMSDSTLAFSGSHLSCEGEYQLVDGYNQAHHQIVSAGNDPYFNQLSQIWSFPTLNTHAIRLGNDFGGLGKESIAKKIIVNATNNLLTFSYALVMSDNHSISQQPYFKVEILDANNLNVNYNQLVNLDNGLNIIRSANPILDNAQAATYGTVFKEWECVTIDLSSLIGTEIIIKFETRDCTQGCHWAYAYLDNFCLSCKGSPSNTGTVTLNSDTCGIPSILCIDYTLPYKGNQTGTAEFTLDLIQNGIIVSTITSPVITSGSMYCFNLNSNNTSGLNNALNGFDFKITGKFTLDSYPLADKIIGTSAEGVSSGVNNDHLISCPGPSFPNCCQVDLEIFNASGTPNPLPVVQSVHHGIPLSYAKETFEIHADATLPITELRVVVTDIQYEYNYDACAECVNNPALWGTIIAPVNPIGTSNGGLSHQNPDYMTPTGSAITNRESKREIIWTNPDGSLLQNGDQFEVHYLLPPASEIPCCVTSVKICTNISWKDANCNVCDSTYTCSIIQLGDDNSSGGNSGTCDCGEYKTNQITVKMPGARGALDDRYIRCGRTITEQTRNGQFIFKAPVYACSPTTCIAQFKWEILNDAGKVIDHGDGNVFSYAFRGLTKTKYKNFTVRFTPVCGGKDCKPCEIHLRLRKRLF